MSDDLIPNGDFASSEGWAAARDAILEYQWFADD